jgi:Rod binding domain-containing protein
MTPIAGIGGVAVATAPTPPAAADRQATEHGEGFERLLLGQLTKQLVDSAMPADAESSAATGAYRQMLPDALTEALMSAGGIGLAKQLADASTNPKASA